MSFQNLQLSDPIVRAVAAQGYSTPTPIQSQSIPEALAGRDILGCAQTGTGKTCAFALPILHRLTAATDAQDKHSNRGSRGRAPRALILAPTRELAVQIFESFVAYGRNVPLRHTVVFGGVSQVRQVRTLRDGVDILVATPGRLLDLINQGHIDLRAIEVLVLDEADRMLDMGFINDIRKVVKMLPEERQTLFFSATMSREIRRLADSILTKPVNVETTPETMTVEAISQRVYMVERRNKGELLQLLLGQDEVERTLVFTRTKYGADKLVKLLRRARIHAEAIHGNKTQNARTRAMKAFKAGSTPVLVATDIASRGIDVDEITHVVNYDMPVDPDTYVHRIGRTARAGASGVAVSFCDRDEISTLRAIERRTQIQLEVADDMPDLVYHAPATSPREKPSRHAARRSGSGKPRSTKYRARDDRGDSNGNKSSRKSKPSRASRKASTNSNGADSGRSGGRNSSSSNDRPSNGAGPGRKRKTNAAGRSRNSNTSGGARKTSTNGHRGSASRTNKAARR